MPQVLLHVLFEHAAGYALFAVREVEEIGLLLPQVRHRHRQRGSGRNGMGGGRMLGTGWERTGTGIGGRRAHTGPGAGSGERWKGGEGLGVSGGVVSRARVERSPPGSPQVEESVLTLGKFHNVVKLVAFSPFRSAQSALENMNAVSEGECGAGTPGPPCPGEPRAALIPPCPAGVLHEDLRLLLDTALPPKRKKVVLGVGDAKMGAAVLEELGVQCQTGGVVAELLRGEWGQRDRGHRGGVLG